jgi:bacterioferritin-associated ferredoxin
MIICHCKGISDRTIRAAIRAGAGSCQQVESKCEAGRYCGGCRPLIRELIECESSGSRSALLAMLGLSTAS